MRGATIEKFKNINNLIHSYERDIQNKIDRKMI